MIYDDFKSGLKVTDYEDYKLHLGIFALHKLQGLFGLQNLREEGALLQIKTIQDGLQQQHLLKMLQLLNRCWEKIHAAQMHRYEVLKYWIGCSKNNFEQKKNFVSGSSVVIGFHTG